MNRQQEEVIKNLFEHIHMLADDSELLGHWDLDDNWHYHNPYVCQRWYGFLAAKIHISKPDTYIHTKTGKQYRILSNPKVKVNGVWEQGVLYTESTDIMELQTYVRTETNFKEKFQQMKD